MILFEKEIKKIDKFIQSPINSSTKEKLYEKPNHLWCLDNEIKNISKSFSNELREICTIAKKQYPDKKINYIDLFAGGTLLSLNILNNMEDIVFDNILFNDIAYKNKDILENIKVDKKIEYFDMDLNIESESFTDSSKFDCFFKEKDLSNSINIIVFNPLIGTNKSTFHISYIEKFFNLINSKYTKKINKNIDNNVLVFFSSLDLEDKKLKKQNNDIILFNDNKKITYIKKIDNDFGDIEKKNLAIKKIFNPGIQIKPLDKNPNNIYNIYIFNGMNPEKRVHYKYFDGKNIMSENDYEDYLQNKINENFLTKLTMKDIKDKYISLMKEIL